MTFLKTVIPIKIKLYKVEILYFFIVTVFLTYLYIKPLTLIYDWNKVCSSVIKSLHQGSQLGFVKCGALYNVWFRGFESLYFVTRKIKEY